MNARFVNDRENVQQVSQLEKKKLIHLPDEYTP